MVVGELLVALGFKVDKGSLAFANRTIGSIRRAALGLGAVFGLKGLGQAMFGFNAELENSRVQIAGMLAQVKHTTLASELDTAAKAVDNLNKRATELPGSTMDYIKVLKQISYPVLKAGGDMAQLEELTVGVAQAAKAVDTDIGTASRNILRALSGNVQSRDLVTRRLVESSGMELKAFKELTKSDPKKALEVLVRGAKKVQETGEALGKTTSGQLEQLRDRVTKFLARVGESAFGGIKQALTDINAWWKRNEKDIEAFADRLGSGLRAVFDFFAEGGDEAKAVLITLGVLAGIFAINMLLAAAPILLIAATVGLIAYGLLKLLGLSDDLGDMWRDGADGAEDLALTSDNLANRLEAGLQAAGERIKKVLGDAWDAAGLKVEEFVDRNAFWMGSGSLLWSHDQKAKREGGRKWGDLMMEAPTVNNPRGGGRYLGDPGLDVAENGRTAYGPGAFGGSSEKGINVTVGDIHISGVSDEKRMADIMSGEFATVLRRTLAAQNGGGK